MLAHVLIGGAANAVSRVPPPVSVEQSRMYVVQGVPYLKASVRTETLYVVRGPAALNNINSQSSSLYAVVTE